MAKILTGLFLFLVIVVNAQSNPYQKYIPAGYNFFAKYEGDLNKDGKDDLVLIVKDTKKSEFVYVEYRKETLDRNRRGIIILFKTENGYQKVLQNFSCFSSENEDGGVYYAPELDIEILNNKLYVNYRHGRYGYWDYTFRYQNNDFSLIGYEHHYNRGPATLHITSINFLTGEHHLTENLNQDAEDDVDEKFKTTKTRKKVEPLLKLSEIKDFDGLRF